MQKFLQKCARIEELAGEVYLALAASPQLSWDFRVALRKLAADEGEHAEKIRLAQRLLREEILTGVSLPEERVDALLKEILEMLEEVRGQHLSEEQAVALAVRLEKDFCQVHIDAVAEFADPQMRAMFRALARDDEEHMNILKDYLQSR